MPPFIDETGNHYGKWTVLKRAKKTGQAVYWLCFCDPARGGCGRVKRNVIGPMLRNGLSTSCGSPTCAERFKPLPDKVGDLRVLGPVVGKSGYCRVRCERKRGDSYCGATFRMSVSKTRGAQPRTCCRQCSYAERTRDLSKLSTENKATYPNLEFLGLAPRRRAAKDRHARMRCRCKLCGRQFEALTKNIEAGRTKSCGLCGQQGKRPEESMIRAQAARQKRILEALARLDPARHWISIRRLRKAARIGDKSLKKTIKLLVDQGAVEIGNHVVPRGKNFQIKRFSECVRLAERTSTATTRQQSHKSLFIPTELQIQILDLLIGKALTGDALEAKLQIGRARLYYGPSSIKGGAGGLDELKRLDRVNHSRRLGGYFRPDYPPEIVRNFNSGNGLNGGGNCFGN